MLEKFVTYYKSPIGIIKIAATEHYITEVRFVDDEQDVTFSHTSIQLLHHCVEEMIEYFNGKRRTFDLPVYQQGSTFQERVWSELLSINFGRTISYMDLAKKLGDPKCIRAAATSNGKNQLCVIVPCHRVIGSGAKLVGYSGGLWRKRWLLNHENKIAHGVQTLF